MAELIDNGIKCSSKPVLSKLLWYRSHILWSLSGTILLVDFCGNFIFVNNKHINVEISVKISVWVERSLWLITC